MMAVTFVALVVVAMVAVTLVAVVMVGQSNRPTRFRRERFQHMNQSCMHCSSMETESRLYIWGKTKIGTSLNRRIAT
jgi:hypothetical protein